MCYTYAECLALLRAGEEIDYEGVTGSAIYTEGGVNDVKPSYTPFNDDGTVGDFVLIDADPEYLTELVPEVTSLAECDENNVRSWGG